MWINSLSPADTWQGTGLKGREVGKEGNPQNWTLGTKAIDRKSLI